VNSEQEAFPKGFDIAFPIAFDGCGDVKPAPTVGYKRRTAADTVNTVGQP
jgi:hypothetical protein